MGPISPKTPVLGESGIKTKYGGSWFVPARATTLMARTVLLYTRDPAVYTFRFILYCFMSGFLGVTYHQVSP